MCERITCSGVTSFRIVQRNNRKRQSGQTRLCNLYIRKKKMKKTQKHENYSSTDYYVQSKVQSKVSCSGQTLIGHFKMCGGDRGKQSGSCVHRTTPAEAQTLKKPPKESFKHIFIRGNNKQRPVSIFYALSELWKFLSFHV